MGLVARDDAMELYLIPGWTLNKRRAWCDENQNRLFRSRFETDAKRKIACCAT